MTTTTAGTLGDGPDSRVQDSVPSGKRIVDRLDPRLVNALTALGFGLPVAGYYWFLSRFSIDVMFGDQWDEVSVVRQSYVHFFPLGAMWIQHNENRIFFQNVIVVLLAHTVHFNIQLEEYLSSLMLVVAVVLILWAHKRRSSSTPWLYYCPVVVLAFSVVQEGNTIWGFQIGWYLVLVSLATAIILLDGVTLTWVTLLGAMVAGVVGSFSSLQGLLIWPTGLVLLYFRRRSLPQIAVWLGVAVASTLLYFHNYKFSVTPDRHFASQHPLAALKFFLFAIGDVVGKPVGLGHSNPDNTYVVLLGLAIVILAVGTVLICGLWPDQRGASPVGIALISYGLLFAATITQGRSFIGYSAASFSRYTTFDLLILVGIYLALLDCRPHPIEADAGQLASNLAGSPSLASGRRRTRVAGGWVDRVALRCGRVAVLVVIVLQIPFGIHYGVQQARSDYANNVRAVSVLRNIHHESDFDVTLYLFLFNPASWIREQAQTLEEHHLSVFANG